MTGNYKKNYIRDILTNWKMPVPMASGYGCPYTEYKEPPKCPKEKIENKIPFWRKFKK